jgi:hypothetical protein
VPAASAAAARLSLTHLRWHTWPVLQHLSGQGASLQWLLPSPAELKQLPLVPPHWPKLSTDSRHVLPGGSGGRAGRPGGFFIGGGLGGSGGDGGGWHCQYASLTRLHLLPSGQHLSGQGALRQ